MSDVQISKYHWDEYLREKCSFECTVSEEDLRKNPHGYPLSADHYIPQDALSLYLLNYTINHGRDLHKFEEFLRGRVGDRIIGMIKSDLLSEMHPKAREFYLRNRK